MDTNNTRTPEAIRAAIMAACKGDYSDTNSRIAQLQADLIAALIWQECPPSDGWTAAYKRQFDALRKMPATGITAFDTLLTGGVECPHILAQNLTVSHNSRAPWDVEDVDAYINGGAK